MQAEAVYAKQVLADTETLQEDLYKELRGRIQEADQTVPLRYPIASACAPGPNRINPALERGLQDDLSPRYATQMVLRSIYRTAGDNQTMQDFPYRPFLRLSITVLQGGGLLLLQSDSGGPAVLCPQAAACACKCWTPYRSHNGSPHFVRGQIVCLIYKISHRPKIRHTGASSLRLRLFCLPEGQAST